MIVVKNKRNHIIAEKIKFNKDGKAVIPDGSKLYSGMTGYVLCVAGEDINSPFTMSKLAKKTIHKNMVVSGDMAFEKGGDGFVMPLKNSVFVRTLNDWKQEQNDIAKTLIIKDSKFSIVEGDYSHMHMHDTNSETYKEQNYEFRDMIQRIKFSDNIEIANRKDWDKLIIIF